MKSPTIVHSPCWRSVLEWGVEGRGWDSPRTPFQRLPPHAEKMVPSEVWTRGASATGISVRFETDSPRLDVRWEVSGGEFNEANFSRAAFSGLDLYVRDRGTWRWVAIAEKVTNRFPEQTVMEGLSRKRRQFLLYLPLRNPVKKLELGVDSDSFFRGIPPRTEQPLVYYGSSIVHGAYASRAGRVHPSLLGRMLDWPVVNLGFSGQAKMHPGMAQLLGEIDARAYVIDPLPNMDPALIRERALPFILALREARPTTPIILVEDFPVTGSWIFPARMKIHREKWRLFSRLYQKLKSEGDRQLYYVEGKTLIGLDNEGTLDGIHPNDLGYQRLAEGLFPTLRSVLEKENGVKPVTTRG